MDRIASIPRAAAELNKRLPSNIGQLEHDFDSILLDSRDGDGSGLLTSIRVTRHTFIFKDGSRLHVTEELSGGFINVSYYNWVDHNGEDVLKFHSEPHDSDQRYQTATEPHHLHPRRFEFPLKVLCRTSPC